MGTLPAALAASAFQAFSACGSVTTLTLGTNLASIGDQAFTYCVSLTNVAIPASTTSFGEGVFADCGNLTNITVDPANPKYSSAYGVLFDKQKTTLVEFPAGQTGSYTIPVGVPNIAAQAFYEDPNLTSLIIPNSVVNIGSDAFEGCPNLTTVTIGTGVTNISDFAFAYSFSMTSAYFHGNAPPDDGRAFSGDSGATAYYLRGTKGWSNTFGSIPAVLWNPQAQTGGMHFGIVSNL